VLLKFLKKREAPSSNWGISKRLPEIKEKLVRVMRTEKQETFIEQYCLHGCAAKAAQIAGYSHPKQRGYELKNQFSKEIEARTRKLIQDCVPGALSQLKSLSEGAESESVRLGAVKDILDRAGLKPTEKIKQEVSHVEEKSTEELQRELEALVGPLN
jgi:phage terminase small subunit